MRTGHYEVYQSSVTGKWRWRFVGANGEKVASGQAYVREADAKHAIELLKGSAGAPVKRVRR